MPGISHLDEIIDFKEKVLDIISKDQRVVGLILNNPNIVIGGAEAYKIFDENLFDFDYVDDTVQSSTAMIMAEIDIVEVPTSTIKIAQLYVQVVVCKTYMRLDKKIFKGVRGNRRDNLVRYIDLLLRESKEFGIKPLELQSVVSATVPSKFTSKLMTYDITAWAKDRKLITNG